MKTPRVTSIVPGWLWVSAWCKVRWPSSYIRVELKECDLILRRQLQLDAPSDFSELGWLCIHSGPGSALDTLLSS